MNIDINKLLYHLLFSQLEVKIDKIFDLRLVPVRDHQANVLDIKISEGTHTGKLTAWGILADFLHVLLSGKEVLL